MRIRSLLALTAWLLAVAGAGALLWRTSPANAPVSGRVESALHTVGAHEAGRVSAVLVEPGQAVSAGAPLVLLATADLDAELAVARAELVELVGAVEAEGEALRQSLRKERLDAEARLAQAKATLADARAVRASHVAERESLTGQLDRLEGALRNGLTAVDHVTSLRARERALARSTALAPGRLKAWRTLTDRVSETLAAVADNALDVRLRPLTARVETQHRRLERLLLRRAARTLRAPRDGVVAAVLQRTGDAVVAGGPVVTLRAAPDRVVAWLAPNAVDALPKGRRVRVFARDGRVRVTGVVTRLGPAVESVPEQLWISPDRPKWGRPVYLTLDAADAALVAGEPVRLSTAALPLVPTAVAAARVTGGPAPLTVPAGLAARSAFEPSGAVWLPERGRFLVVSDDTGLKNTPTEDAPWVFLVDPAGAADPEPWVIEGFAAAAGRDTVTDFESVTRAADGTLWFLSSQSVSRKGKRKKKRQQLVHARIDGSRLVALGAAPVYRQLERLPAAQQAALGLGDALDIEAMAWVDGGLVLGLKAPLGEAGQARLWRVERPERLLADDPVGAGVRPLGGVKLPTGPGGAPGGVSDVALDGGHLLLTSTLATGADQGCAWRIAWPLDGKAPQRLACWPGLKPEAITRGPEGVVVFFDSNPPRWTPLP